jgi:cation-transporting ATPase 13A1
MFKILALNCLLSAYSLSVLALKGIKFSDYQSTYMGFVVAFYFLMLSKGEPLKKLNSNRPPYTIFSIPSIISILGQAITHLASLYIIIQMTEVYDPLNINLVKSLDDPFSPTLMNSIIFVYSALNQTINFVVNYQGEPFMKNMSENKWMMRLSWGIVILSGIVIFDLHPQLNESLEILPLPDDMTYKLGFVGIMAADFVICYLLENWKKLFGYYKI